ncbi:hypothetical protein [Streptomyces aureus]
MAGSTHPGRAALAAELVALERAALRARAGRSRAEACREAGKSLKTVADWFSGKSAPKDFTTLRSVVEVLLDWRFGTPQNPTERAQRDAVLLRWRELWK